MEELQTFSFLYKYKSEIKKGKTKFATDNPHDADINT